MSNKGYITYESICVLVVMIFTLLGFWKMIELIILGLSHVRFV